MKLPDKPFKMKELLRNNLKEFSKAMGDESFRKEASEYNKRYLYWSELEYRVKDESRRKFIWAFMKFLRSDYYQRVSTGKIDMKYSLTSEISKKLHLFDQNLSGNLQIEGKALSLSSKYVISSLMEEAIASSQLEGASTTRKVAKAMLREKRKPSNESERMISNNYEAMQFVIKQRENKLSPEMLLEIQRIVTKDSLKNPEDCGKFRDNNDITVSNDEVIAHIPPAYTELPLLIKELCQFANEDTAEEFVHPIIKGIILHFLIGYIHPFNDGNGRTARTIFYWYMLSKGYWLFEYMAVSRQIVRSRTKYDLAYLYTEYDEMDVTYFLKYNLDAVEDALHDMIEYIKKQQEEQKKTKEFINKNPNLSLRQALILEEFMKNPEKLFTIKEISETYGIVYQTARADLLFLEEKLLISHRVSGKTFLYIYKGH